MGHCAGGGGAGGASPRPAHPVRGEKEYSGGADPSGRTASKKASAYPACGSRCGWISFDERPPRVGWGAGSGLMETAQAKPEMPKAEIKRRRRMLQARFDALELEARQRLRKGVAGGRRPGTVAR